MLRKRKLRQGATELYILESFTLYLRNYMGVILRAIENCVCSIRCIGREMRPISQTVYAQTREQMPPWILLPMHHFSTYNSNHCTLQYRQVTLYSLQIFVHCMDCLCILESRDPPIFSLKISLKMFDNRLKSTQKVYSLGLTCMLV
jgi:hypothetical protein